MSATSQTIQLDTRVAGDDVRAAIRRLAFRRRLWRACALISSGMACLFILLCLVGVVDYARPLARGLRVGMVAPLLSGVAALTAYAVWLLVERRRLSERAREVERAAQQSENALVTFAENVERGQDVKPYMLARVEAQARRMLEGIDARVMMPRREAARGAALLLLSLLFMLALRLAAPAAFAREARRVIWLEADEVSFRKSSPDDAANLESNAIALESFRVRVVPPAYSGLSAEEAVGDAPVRALLGSQIEVELTATGKFDRASLSFGGATVQMRAVGEGRYTGSFIAQASGAFEARIIADEEQAPAPIVRAVEVYADAPPEAHITEPASDQLLRGLPSNPVTVRWTARDDLGLADVTLKYIKSRGEGDAAQFTNGVIPLGAVERGSVREWRGAASLDLARLGMQPGDTLVYWLEARDRNPAANNTGRSATLAIALVAPEPVKLNLGDLGPNEIGRFLLSQRMIIIHTEKLHNERARLKPEELNRRSQEIASEQREFKNSFNDFIRLEGAGEDKGDTNAIAPQSVEEQAREAADERTDVHMHGIPEPPQGTPNNVRDMIYAIRAMWDAEDALSLTDTAKALVYEREALTRLKRAQLAVRYVPPVVARSKPIDLKRRYAGELNEIKTRLEKLSRRAESKESASLRSALTDAYSALNDLQGTLDVPVTARASAVGRAREKARQAADRLQAAGGDHAATIAEATGQLRIVETELSTLELGGTSDEYAARVTKSLSLLTQAAGNLFAIAEATTRANVGEAGTLLPADDARAAEYFRRLNK
ncbi:MAG TPA: hypothetical protein VGC91_00145 [Pyrinomonadaceae bacterium]